MMRAAKVALAVLATPLCVHHAGAAETASPYIDLGLGASFLEGLPLTGLGGSTAHLNENVGVLGTAAYGYALGNGFRAELEFGYRGNSAKNVTLPSGGTTPTSLNLKADAVALSYMVNGLYNFDLGSPWTPYLGLGVGAASVRVSNVGHDWPFAWGAMAGIEYAVAPNLYLGAEYKFLGTEGLKFHSTSVQSHSDYHDHAFLLTLRWNLAAPKAHPAAYVPPPPPLQAAPTSPPAPEAQMFTVYFELNKDTITAEAHSVIQNAAAAAKSEHVTHINIVGHTDTSGPPQYNERLSLQRAAAVRAELERNGVPASEILIVGRGESDLAVPTGDEVKEPRNRRVVIVLLGPGV